MGVDFTEKPLESSWTVPAPVYDGNTELVCLLGAGDAGDQGGGARFSLTSAKDKQKASQVEAAPKKTAAPRLWDAGDLKIAPRHVAATRLASSSGDGEAPHSHG